MYKYVLLCLEKKLFGLYLYNLGIMDNDKFIYLIWIFFYYVLLFWKISEIDCVEVDFFLNFRK